MHTGTVKWFDNEKGYGFICPDSGGSDVFLHISSMKKSKVEMVETGNRVRYDLEPSRDGREMAGNIVIE